MVIMIKVFFISIFVIFIIGAISGFKELFSVDWSSTSSTSTNSNISTKKESPVNNNSSSNKEIKIYKGQFHRCDALCDYHIKDNKIYKGPYDCVYNSHPVYSIEGNKIYKGFYTINDPCIYHIEGNKIYKGYGHNNGTLCDYHIEGNKIYKGYCHNYSTLCIYHIG